MGILSKTLLVSLTVLALILLSFVVVSILRAEDHRFREYYRPLSRNTTHQFAWISLSLFVASNFYSVLKRTSPKNIKAWLLIHCVSGASSLLFACLHVIGGLWPRRSGDFLSFFAFFLMMVVAVSGALEKSVKNNFVRSNCKILHVSLTILFYFILALHIFEKLALL